MITIGSRVKVSSTFYVKEELLDNTGTVVSIDRGEFMVTYRVQLDKSSTLAYKVWAFYDYELEPLKELVGL